MEGGCDDPPVPGPLVALVGAHAAVQQPLELPEADLLEVAELVGQDLPHQLRLGDGHLRHRPGPGDRRLACTCRQSIFKVVCLILSLSQQSYTCTNIVDESEVDRTDFLGVARPAHGGPTVTGRQRRGGDSERDRGESCYARTVLRHGVVEERHGPGHDGVAARRQGRAGPGLPGEPVGQRRVAGQRAVRRAAEALRPQRPAQAPRPQPRPLRQRARGAPRDGEDGRAQQQRRLRLPRSSCWHARRHGSIGYLIDREARLVVVALQREGGIL
jgi:hypothetical protein